MTKPKGPMVVELDALPDLPDTQITEISEEMQESGAIRSTNRGARLINRGERGAGSRLLKLALAALGGLLVMAFGMFAWNLVTSLIQSSPVLGAIAIGLVAILSLALLLILLREIAGLVRLRKIDSLRHSATRVRQSQNLEDARNLVNRLQAHYQGREDAAWGAARLTEISKDAVDADDILDAAERQLLAPLDALALAEIEVASARVATVTALIPLALADVATALVSGVSMIRRIAAIYGGRSGTIGAWRLMRGVIVHLAATGAVAVGDDLIGSALGGSVLSKLSRRFGEGLINGALTARLGVIAMELCRPVPFHATPRPSVTAIVRRALTGLFSTGR